MAPVAAASAWRAAAAPVKLGNVGESLIDFYGQKAVRGHGPSSFRTDWRLDALRPSGIEQFLVADDLSGAQVLAPDVEARGFRALTSVLRMGHETAHHVGDARWSDGA